MKGGALSGLLWPIRLKPLRDELLSSWLMRLSRAYGLNPHSFCSIVWPGQYVWNRDIDHLASPSIIEMLARRTGVSIQRASETTLPTYAGVVFEALTETGRTSWVLPLGIWHRQHLRFGQQFCPDCLEEDEEPYYRRAWRLAFITCCLRHRRALLDRCPKCNSPVNFFYNKAGRENLALCGSCDFDLRLSRSLDDDPSLYELQSQRSLQRTLERGWASLGDFGPTYSHLYFQGLRVISRLLLSPGRRHLLTTVLDGDELTSRVSRVGKHHTLEDHEIDTRRAVVLAAWSLTQGWPNSFVRVCRQHRVRGADVLRDAKVFPYWLERAVRQDLGLPTSPIASKEVASSVSYLKKLGLPLTNQNIFRLLGRTVPPDASKRVKKALRDTGRQFH